MTPAYAKKVDANQAQIVEALRAAGASVTDLSRFGQGVPDLLIGYNGVNYLQEVKGEDGELTPAEERWFARWNGSVQIVRTQIVSLRAIGAMA